MPRGHIGYALVLGAALCFSTLGLASRAFYDGGGDAFTLLVVRFVAAGPLFLLLAALLREPMPSLRGLALASGLGLFQLGSTFALLIGYGEAPIGLVAVVFYVYPLLVTAGASRWLGEKVSARGALLLAVGLTGVVLTIGAPERGSVVGVACGLVAAVFVAATIVLARRLMQRHGLTPLIVTGAGFTSPVVVLLPAAAVHGVALQADAAMWSLLAFVVVVSTVLPFWLFYAGLRAMRASTASVLVTLEPVAAAVLAYVILDEALTGLQLLGGALIVAAVTLLALQGAREARAPA